MDGQLSRFFIRRSEKDGNDKKRTGPENPAAKTHTG